MRSVEQRYKEIQAEHPERDALVAAQGWCAPSETDYDICLQITTDGLSTPLRCRRGVVASVTTPASSSTPSSVAATVPPRPASST